MRVLAVQRESTDEAMGYAECIENRRILRENRAKWIMGLKIFAYDR